MIALVAFNTFVEFVVVHEANQLRKNIFTFVHTCSLLSKIIYLKSFEQKSLAIKCKSMSYKDFIFFNRTLLLPHIEVKGQLSEFDWFSEMFFEILAANFNRF